MANLIYGFTALTGGAADALDYIDGDVLVDKDVAIGCVSGVFYTYSLDADSAAAESSPSVVSPATNAGDKRWIQTTVYNSLPAAAYELTDGATIAIDWSNGATQYVVLGAPGRTVTFANPVNGAVYRFIIIQDGSGSQTITTWPTIKWAGGAAPILSTTGDYIDIVTLLYCNGVYYGDCSFDFRTPA